MWTALALLALAPFAPQDPPRCPEVTVITWNMQSDYEEGRQESDPAFLAQQMADKGPVDLWGLTEVLDQDTLETFEAAIEESTGYDYEARLSELGHRDRLAILYRADRFEAVGDFFQLRRVMAGNWGLRPAFAVKLQEAESGQQFFFVVNHFKCCGGEGPDIRVKQARALKTLVAEEHVPIIAVGDYNTPFRPGDEHRSRGLRELTKDDGFLWIEPVNPVRTQRSGSILDYIFVANPVDGWTAESTILKRHGNEPAREWDSFFDDERSTDHRPVKAVFRMDCTQRVEAVREEIRLLEARLQALREELARLEKR